MLEDLQNWLETYVMWIAGAMILLGAVQIFLPAFVFATMINSILAAVLVIYFVLYGVNEQFDFKGELVMAFAITGFALTTAGITGITGALSYLGPLAALATVFAIPLTAIGGSLLMLAMFGAIQLTK